MSFVTLQEMNQHVLKAEITRPEALNALNLKVLQDLESTIHQIKNRKDIAVVILSGAGEKAFVAGADIKEMLEFSPDQAREFSQYGQAVFHQLENLSPMVIARVQGFALGGGLELALSCDWIIAGEKGKFGLPEVTLGLIPGFGGTQRLTQRIGSAKALEWISTGKMHSAPEALSCGLVNHVVPQAELDSFIETQTSLILANGPKAVKSMKAVVRESTKHLCGSFELEAARFAICFDGPEAREGLSAFTNKRKAQFR